MYQCKLHWGWGSMTTFHEETEFYIDEKSDLPEELKKILVKICRRYSFDCGRLDSPLHPWVGEIEIIPIMERECIHLDEIGMEYFMENEEEYTRELIENDKLFIHGEYDLNVSPKNKGK